MQETKILIVDDDQVSIHFLKSTLNKMGYATCTPVADGDAAIAMMETCSPDLIIMDIMLEGEMDGIQAAEIIRKKSSTPLVFITAHEEESLFERARITEPYGYMIKPVSTRELHMVVEMALYRRKLDAALEDQVEQRTIELTHTIKLLNTEIKKKKEAAVEQGTRTFDVLQRNQSMERDLKNAEAIQRALLPLKNPKYPNLNISYRYKPLDVVGGDFFSFTPMKEGGLGLFIGDVESHGISAALFTSLVKFATNNVCRLYGQQPVEYMDNLNKELLGFMANSFLAAMYLYFQYNENRSLFNIDITAAGNPYPVLERRQENEISILKYTGPLLGCFDDISFRIQNIELKKGDRLYLFTDGLVEAMDNNRKMLNSDGLVAIIREKSTDDLEETIDGVLNSVLAYTNGKKFDDDVLFIVCECIPE